MIAFLTAAATMVVLFFGLALAIAATQEAVVSTLKASTQAVKRWGGWILVTIGVWLILLGVFADAFARVLPV